jgi:hypothetical protein
VQWLLLSGYWAVTMVSHQSRETIQVYFDSMYDSSADKVHAAIHPNAKITAYLEGD